jgi:hypothetical protein
VSPVKYEQGFYIPEDDILHSDLRENLKSYKAYFLLRCNAVQPVEDQQTFRRTSLSSPGSNKLGWMILLKQAAILLDLFGGIFLRKTSNFQQTLPDNSPLKS